MLDGEDLIFLHTCVTTQKRLVRKVIDEVLQGCKHIKAKVVAVVFANHMKMLHRILRPGNNMANRRLTQWFTCTQTGFLESGSQ